MANYYTQFSCIFDVVSADNAARALEIYDNPPDWPRDEFPLVSGFAISQLEDQLAHQLWIYSEETGDPELVVAFVLMCAKAFDLKGFWGFEYANVCSKPHLGSFGGGAHLIDLGARQVVGRISSFEWLRSSLARSASHG